MQNVTYQGLVITVGVILAMLAAYNVAMTAWKNHRQMANQKRLPLDQINATLQKHAQMLASDKRRLDHLERESADTHDGVMALCQGVQALLEHELHNGNADEMTEASKNINKWLRTRM